MYTDHLPNNDRSDFVKKIKSFTSIIVIIAFIFGIIPTTFAEINVNVLVEDGFDSYITYDKPPELNVSGYKYYITEYESQNKGLEFLLSSANQSIDFYAETATNYYISFDILTDNYIDGALLVNAGNKEILIQINDSKVCTHNGMKLFGIKGSKKNIGIEVDKNSRSYTIYENGKAVISDFYGKTIPQTNMSGFCLEFSSKERDASVLIDNVCAVEGTYKNTAKYIKSVYLDKTTEKPVFDKKISSDAYLKYDFEPGKRENVAYNGKGNVLEKHVMNDGNNAIILQKITSSDMHLDIDCADYDSDVLVYSIDVYPMNSNSNVQFNLRDSAPAFVSLFTLSGAKIDPGNNQKKSIMLEKWSNVSVVIDKLECLKTVYLNNEIIAENIQINSQFSWQDITGYRVHINGSQTGDSLLVDNIAIYGGAEPREIGEIEQKKASIESGKSLFESDAIHHKFMENKIGLHIRSGLLYANGKKQILRDKPYIEDGRTLVPVRAVSEAFNIRVDYDASTRTVTVGDNAKFVIDSKDLELNGEKIELDVPVRLKNSRTYLPLRVLCEEILGKTVLYDDTTISSGMIIMGDGDISFPTGDTAMQELNDFLLYQRPDTNTVLNDYKNSSLYGVHPRILATQEDFERIKSLCETDSRMATWKRQLIETANGYLDDETLIYELRDGVRLWYVSMDMVRYANVLGLAYQITGDKVYADKLYEHMESIAAFPGWHPEHTLDIGGLGVGMAIGYDWLYHYMTPEQRAYIEKGMYDNCLNDYILGYQDSQSSMERGITSTNNWNAVVNGGASIAAMSLFDVYSEECAYIVANATRGAEYAIYNFAPNGSWFEGIGYACMTQEYLAYQFAPLEQILGTTYALDATEGLSSTARSILYLQSPLGAFAYLDNASTSVQYDAAMFWFAEHYDDGGVVGTWLNLLGSVPQGDDLARTMLWYKPDSVGKSADMSLDIYNPGDEIVTMRDEWSKDSMAFVGAKGGTPGMAHGHMDIGDFAYYANGAMWTGYLGGEDYNLPGYWDYNDESFRWSYYGLRAEAKNCLVIDPDEYGGFKSEAKAEFIKYESKNRGTIAVLDMTDSYGLDKVSHAKRGFFFTDERRSLVVRDEMKLNGNSELYWFMQTAQNVEVIGDTVVLSQKDSPSNKVVITFECSAPFELSVGKSEPLSTSPHPDGMADRSRFKRIMLKMETSGDAYITAKLTPVDVYGTDVSEFNKSVMDWSIPDGELTMPPVLDTLIIDGVEYDVKTKNIDYFYKGYKTETPEIKALSSKYDVKINDAKSFDSDVTITLTDSHGTTSIYTIAYHEIPEVKVDGYKEIDIAGIIPSAVPQLENGAENVLDRELSTRWSAEGEQYIILDLGKDVDFAAVAMAFYNGDARNYSINISVSSDNVSYNSIYDGKSSGMTNDYECFTFEQQRARYIKIKGDGSSANAWNSWSEIAVMKAE